MIAQRAIRFAIFTSMTESSRRRSWWTTLPGVLTGIASVITAIAALLGALQVLGVFDKEKMPAGAANTVTPGVTSTPSGQAADPPTVAPTPTWVGALRSGVLVMKNGDAADLKSGKTGFAVGTDLYAFTGTSGQVSTQANHPDFYISPHDGEPNKASCRAALDGRRISDIDLTPSVIGKWWCIHIANGYVGALQVTELSSDSPQSVTLNYVLWE